MNRQHEQGGMGGGMMGAMMGGMMASGNTQRTGATPESGAPTIDVSAREFSFSPSKLTLRAGQTVNIDFSDDGGMLHTFTLVDGPDFSLQANPGLDLRRAEDRKARDLQFICTVAGHAQQGMRGTITAT